MSDTYIKKLMNIFSNDDTEPSEPRVPERTLLAAVLERAYRDIVVGSMVERHTVVDALAWFSDKRKNQKRDGLSYSYIAETLELGPAQLEYIDRVVAESRKRIYTKKKETT